MLYVYITTCLTPVSRIWTLELGLLVLAGKAKAGPTPDFAKFGSSHSNI